MLTKQACRKWKAFLLFIIIRLSFTFRLNSWHVLTKFSLYFCWQNCRKVSQRKRKAPRLKVKTIKFGSFFFVFFVTNRDETKTSYSKYIDLWYLSRVQTAWVDFEKVERTRTATPQHPANVRARAVRHTEHHTHCVEYEKGQLSKCTNIAHAKIASFSKVFSVRGI